MRASCGRLMFFPTRMFFVIELPFFSDNLLADQFGIDKSKSRRDDEPTSPISIFFIKQCFPFVLIVSISHFFVKRFAKLLDKLILAHTQFDLCA